jgi:hypothetical protein
LFLAQGFTKGLGEGLVFCPTISLVATCFSTRRSLAIAMTAGPIVEWSAFKEQSYISFCIGMFFNSWAVSFAIFYASPAWFCLGDSRLTYLQLSSYAENIIRGIDTPARHERAGGAGSDYAVSQPIVSSDLSILLYYSPSSVQVFRVSSRHQVLVSL